MRRVPLSEYVQLKAEDGNLLSGYAVAKAHPEVTIYSYPDAGHAFNRDADPNMYVADAAKLAQERTLAFLRKNVAS
jgi:dienelactone hydrolase